MKIRLLSLTGAGYLLAAASFAQTAPAPVASPSAPTPLATPQGTSRLTGLVLDAATRKPVEYATVALLTISGNKPVDGTVCDDKGRFSLSRLAAGSYQLQVSFLGYTPQIQTVTVTEGALDLGTIALTAAAQKLGEVKVTGERAVIETKPDRIVYNADRDLTNSGGTAADVLRKVPLVNVDPDGNVELRGTSNVRVLINNKPSGVIASSVADAMKQIPADQIKSVEVITTPSAKYDAEGTGGIINIILKKNNLEGVNGSVGLAAGTRNSNGNASLNWRRGKVGLNSSASGFGFYGPNRNDLERRVTTTDGTQPLALTQRGEGYGMGGGGFGRLSLDYDPAEHHNLTLSVQGNLFRNSGDNELYNNQLLPISQEFTRRSDRRFRTQSYDLSGSYNRTFAQARREWSVLGQHTRNRNTQYYTLDQFPGAAVGLLPIEYREASDNLSRNLETTLQTDYTHPFSETTTLEAGAKAILRRVSSDYDVQEDRLGSGPLLRSDTRSNVFDYDQNVLSAYASAGFNLGKKVTTRLGTRLEHTDITGRFAQQVDNTRFTQRYTNVLPNMSLSYQPGDPKMPGKTVRLAYSRRIQRPQIFFLNPFVNAADSLNISYGNPKLEPELTDSYELNYTTFVKGTVLNASAYVRRTGNAIESYRFVDEGGVNNQTFLNIGRNATYGASLFTSVKPLPRWDLSGNLNFYYVTLKSASLGLSNNGLMYNMNLNSSYKFSPAAEGSTTPAWLRNWAVQFYGGLNSPRVQLQGKQAAWTFYGLGLRKNFLKDKADLTLNADNFLRQTRNLNTVLETPQFTQTSNNYIYLRGVRLALSYRFGKVENRPDRPKKSIRNDDTKQGEGQ